VVGENSNIPDIRYSLRYFPVRRQTAFFGLAPAQSRRVSATIYADPRSGKAEISHYDQIVIAPAPSAIVPTDAADRRRFATKNDSE
jgi:hypothetical protein